MAETTTEAVGADREAYMSWLRDRVAFWCNGDGMYEQEWDYDSEVSPDEVLEALDAYRDKGFASPEALIEENLIETCYRDTEEGFYDILLDEVSRQPQGVQDAWDESPSIWDDLEAAGYRGVDMRTDKLLGNTQLRANLLLSTPGEQNLDLSSIVDAFGNSARSADLDTIEAADLDNALSYLINQQQHSVSEVYDALGGESTRSPFIDSVRYEIENNSSEVVSELALMVQMDAKAYLDLMESAREGEDKSIVIPRDYASIGIFNSNSGAGGPLGIQLEREAVLPLSMVREGQLEDVRSGRQQGYTVGETYGMAGSFWQQAFELRPGADEGIKEDYGAALATARVAEVMRERDRAPEGIEAVEGEARDAAEAGRGDGSEAQGKDGEVR